MTAGACTHLDSVHVRELPPAPLACEECQKMGVPWVHLRMCLTCGKVGCCDNSLFQHATKHFRETGHPLIRSAEPNESWSWCFVDELAFVLRG